MAWRAVTNQQWELIPQHFPARKRSRKGGRPPLDDRTCFEGMLWILWTGAPWSELPERYGFKSALHRRLKEWAARAVLLNLWRAFWSRGPRPRETPAALRYPILHRLARRRAAAAGGRRVLGEPLAQRAGSGCRRRRAAERARRKCREFFLSV